MSVQAVPRFTPEQYLEAERATEFRNEYYNGQVYAMSGGSYAHGTIIGNLEGELRQSLKGKRCIATPNDVRLRVSPGGLYTYPDVMVVCGEPQFADVHKDTVLNPVLIIEVLSRTTEAHDRGFKFTQYRRIDSFQEYVLVSQTEPRIERFQRQPAGHWALFEHAGLDAACRFDSIGCEVPLAEIYLNVTFNPEEAPAADG